MGALRDAVSTLGIVGELLAFLWQRKLWWLLPVVVALLVIGLLATFASATGIGPFVYTLF
jgi:drug/metabolite transporter superfamily protein YnfA